MKKSMISMLLLVAALFLTTACSKDDDIHSPGSKTFVLVHGSWQGAWIWQNVKEGLEKKGTKLLR